MLAFETEEDVYQIALSYPYTYSRLKERLTFLDVLTSRFQESDYYLGGKKKQIKPSNVFGISSSNLLFTTKQIGSSLVSLFISVPQTKLVQLEITLYNFIDALFLTPKKVFVGTSRFNFIALIFFVTQAEKVRMMMMIVMKYRLGNQEG